MNPVDSEIIRQLIARGESEALEFKKSLGQLRRGVETIAARLPARQSSCVIAVGNLSPITCELLASFRLK